MLPDRVSNPGPLTYESGALPIALRGPAKVQYMFVLLCSNVMFRLYINKRKYVKTNILLVKRIVFCSFLF